ncbi:MAG: aromatic amino acid lyase [Caldisericia bacterium]|nr:aromatic amino acid lyase [Caldisericia bacterium]
MDTEFSKVQDAYSMRCMPQVAGSAFDILKMSKNTLEIEMNSATDNPLLFENGDTLDSISGGNFHGAPIAHACDIAIIAVTDLASIAERRTFRLITGNHSGLPSFLTDNPGLSSGLMIAQYTSANLVTLCKSLCFPSSVDTIPTCEGQEDHVSMAPVSAWRLLEVAKAFVSVCAIELLVSCQAVEMRMKRLGIKNNSGLSKITKKVFDIVRDKVSFISDDEPISPHIKNVEKIILSGKLNIIDSLV